MAESLSYASPGLPPSGQTGRLVSLDAYRGLAMALMASAGLRIGQVVDKLPNPGPTWKWLKYHTDHVEWTNIALWDLIQPAFMFMVGAAMPFSIASRHARGQSFARMLLHAIWRSFLLVVLAIFVTSAHEKQTAWVFTNVLAQIGLGYAFLFLIAWLRPTWQFVVAFAILFFYWLAWALYPLPPDGFNFTTVSVKANWPYHLHGFAAHWDKNWNLGTRFDQWFLNLFPRSEPFTGSTGGYVTLNFIPSLVTMIFGLLAGELLRSGTTGPARKILWLLAGAAVGIGAGWMLDQTGVCPSVKRIWTPSWALFSTGWVLIGLAVFYLVIDVVGLKFWAFPLVVVGMNSIAFYLMFQLWWGFVRQQLTVHFQPVLSHVAQAYHPLIQSSVFLLVLWLVAYWMYRKRAFLKI